MICRPGPAERARTLAYGVAGGSLTALELPEELVTAHVAGPDGAPLLLMPVSSPVVQNLEHAADLPVTFQITDLAPVPLADRVRGTAWLHGWVTEVPLETRREAAVRLSRLHPRPDLLDVGVRIPLSGEEPEWTILSLEVAEVHLQDTWGDSVIEPEDYAAAVPDPFVAVEPSLVSHLDAHHREELEALFRHRFGDVSPTPSVRAVGLDRFGLRVRCSVPGGPAPFDLRFSFPEPAADMDALRRAYRHLFRNARHTAA
ncbi:DUF2470 domain-containing protein [Actinocorallia populi]|uniref:DUF2470 domain-containing protein n=1 Tax=Actinocorallia populi TaxID=2079200 RepID=UPI000D094E9E|nr:DUF2470 domain-containing protein [Actinocorallia populi]